MVGCSGALELRIGLDLERRSELSDGHTERTVLRMCASAIAAGSAGALALTVR